MNNVSIGLVVSVLISPVPKILIYVQIVNKKKIVDKRVLFESFIKFIFRNVTYFYFFNLKKLNLFKIIYKTNNYLITYIEKCKTVNNT